MEVRTQIQDRTTPVPGIKHVDVEACLQGDESSWTNLVQQHDRAIRRAVHWTLSRSREKFALPAKRTTLEYDGGFSAREKFADTSEVEDVVQEVYFRLLRSEYKLLRTFDPQRSSLATWLCVVARSTALDHLRDRRNGYHPSLDEVEEPSVFVEWDEPVCSIPGGLLTPRQMSVIHLSYEKGLEVNEIAQMMDVHPQTVRSIRHAALLRLREYYRTKKETA